MLPYNISMEFMENEIQSLKDRLRKSTDLITKYAWADPLIPEDKERLLKLDLHGEVPRLKIGPGPKEPRPKSWEEFSHDELVTIVEHSRDQTHVAQRKETYLQRRLDGEIAMSPWPLPDWIIKNLIAYIYKKTDQFTNV